MSSGDWERLLPPGGCGPRGNRPGSRLATSAERELASTSAALSFPPIAERRQMSIADQRRGSASVGGGGPLSRAIWCLNSSKLRPKTSSSDLSSSSSLQSVIHPSMSCPRRHAITSLRRHVSPTYQRPRSHHGIGPQRLGVWWLSTMAWHCA